MKIGRKFWLGIGSLIKNNVEIAGNIIQEAGAVVKGIDVVGVYGGSR